MSKENILKSKEVAVKLDIMADKVFSYGLPKSKATEKSKSSSSTKKRDKKSTTKIRYL